MNRRDFSQRMLLATLGCAAAGPAAMAAGQNAAGQNMARQNVAGQKFSLMLWVLGKDLSMEQRLQIVAAAGYNAGELVLEWRSWSAEQRKAIVAKKNALGLAFDVMFTGTAPLTDPAARPQLREEITKALPVAQELGCAQLGFKAGPRMQGVSPEEHKRNIAEGLKLAAEVCASTNLELLLEPIDLLEDKRETVNSVTDAFEIVRSVGSPKVKVLYDFYHEQRGAGNLIEKLNNNIDLVGLVHIADVPGRHHPGTGEMNYGGIYRALAALHYSRYITMEFLPAGDPVAELKAAKAEALTALKTA